MLEIKNTTVMGLNRAVKAIKNSFIEGEIDTLQTPTEKEFNVACKLGSSTEPHQSHDAYLKGIIVQFDIKYPQYWTPEFQRYHFAEIIMSTSKMHKLTALAGKPEFSAQFNKYVDKDLIARLRIYAEKYKEALDSTGKYVWFMRMISNLPMGYELWMTCSVSYLQLKTIWIQRHNHKLKEDWGAFCDWCLSLPKFKELTGCGGEE